MLVCTKLTTGSHGADGTRGPRMWVSSVARCGLHSPAGDQRTTGSLELARTVREVRESGATVPAGGATSTVSSS